MNDYRGRSNGRNRRRTSADDAMSPNGFDRAGRLSAEAQARANATGTYNGPARAANGRPLSSSSAARRSQRNPQASESQHQRQQRGVGQSQDHSSKGTTRTTRLRTAGNRRATSGRGSSQNRQSEAQRTTNRDSRRADEHARTGNSNQRNTRRPQVSQDRRVQRNRQDTRRSQGMHASRGDRASSRQQRARQDAQNATDARIQMQDRRKQQNFRSTQRTQSRQAHDAGAAHERPKDAIATVGSAVPSARNEGQHRTSERDVEQTHRPSRDSAPSAVPPARRTSQPETATSDLSAEHGTANPAKHDYLARIREFAILGFGGIMAVGLVLGLCFFMRPSVSQAENRELTKFPQFTMESFIDGGFTEGTSTWYADTFPFRDRLVGVNQKFKGLYGFESDTQMYGTAATSDEIPAEAGAQTVKKDPIAPETYDSWNLEEDIQGQIMQGLYVKDGSVYATYGFTQEAADDYVNAVNGAADKLDGKTQVYSILIPNNSGILLSEDELAALGGSNQGQAIQYYYDSYSDKVKSIATMDILLEHKDEYLFFRTDHHWTSLAAYYVYRNFCQTKEWEPHELSQFTEEDFSPFLGSYYTQLQLESLAADPDTVQAWIPRGTNEMTYTGVDGSVVKWNVIRDVNDWDVGTKYNCFVGGDQPWAEIHNPAITDGSSCVVVKESYGNAFIPWLVDHYETVYIADFRYINTNVVDFCAKNNVNDLILLNNISIIGSVDVAGKIASIL